MNENERITRKQYEDAIRLIKSFHEQIEKELITEINRYLPEKNWNDLKRGDFITFSKTLKKSITLDKPYQVTYVSDNFSKENYSSFGIRNDNGDLLHLRKYTNGENKRIL